MKKLAFPKFSLLLLMAVLAFSACKKDDPTPEDGILSKDAANVDAPDLPAGTYEAGVRFASSDLTGLVGRQLKEITFYLKELPAEATVKVYAGPNTVNTVILEYEAIIGNLKGNDWNTHFLSTPMTILADNDYWLVVNFVQNEQGRVVGCDAGPAVTDGDWLWDAADQSWLTVRQRTNEAVNINWNIRGTVELP